LLRVRGLATISQSSTATLMLKEKSTATKLLLCLLNGVRQAFGLSALTILGSCGMTETAPLQNACNPDVPSSHANPLSRVVLFLAKRGPILRFVSLLPNHGFCAHRQQNTAQPYFPPGNALSNSYFPDPTSTTTSSPACRAPERSARPANGFPPSLACSSFAFGSRTVAVVFAGTSTCNAVFPSASFQPDSTCPYRVSTDAFAYVNPPPGLGWIKMCL